VGLLLRFLGNTLNSVGVAVGLLLLIIGRCNILALLVVNVAADFETGILGRSSRSGTVSSRKRLARGDLRLRAGLERLQATRGIGNDAEVASERRTDVGGAGLRVDLVMSIKAPKEKKLWLLTW
jgi:hypothetical protein